jgi:hypothetical protein
MPSVRCRLHTLASIANHRQMHPRFARALAARMSSVEESRKRSERKAQYRKWSKENFESRISTLEKEVSKWKAIAKELQLFLDSFFFHITSAFFADIRTCTFHFPLFVSIILRSKSNKKTLRLGESIGERMTRKALEDKQTNLQIFWRITLLWSSICFARS